MQTSKNTSNHTFELGIYEKLITQVVANKINNSTHNYYFGKRKINESQASMYLSMYIQKVIHFALNQLKNNSVEEQIELINGIIKHVQTNFNLSELNNDLLSISDTVLSAIIDRGNCDQANIENYIHSITPETLLTECHLFTGNNTGINLASELNREIQSSNTINLLVSFIKLSGINLIYDQLKTFCEKGNKLNIITTTYMQASDAEAIIKLAALPNCTLKISYNSNQTRLHAKSYLFLRNTGYNTCYIGSSNLSKAAITSGLEWNIKATSIQLPHIIDTVKTTFDTYWYDSQFETYQPINDEHKLKMALDPKYCGEDFMLSFKDFIEAKHYQQAILDKLTVERKNHGNYKNLIVAATGTGKTVIAALDFKRYYQKNPNAHLLFVAHREEILKQSLTTFRLVLNDPNFGELWNANNEATEYRHLFASKDLLFNRLKEHKIPLNKEYYDFIIIDEVHHALAKTYQPLFNRFNPQILLGLTATPERSEGSILPYFNNKTSAEIRLSDALNSHLLAPFHYYGLSDGVDLSKVKWSNGQYDSSELEQVYMSNYNRIQIILKQLKDKVNNPHKACALCFCVSIKHAEFMCNQLQLAGLKARVLSSKNTKERGSIVREFKSGQINYLCVVDIFNEGVDIPQVNTVLFLRPTESLTVFLQQLGRGLRLYENKTHVTVLDFVGHANAKFNFNERFRGLIGQTPGSVKEEIERDFPHLPFGCAIHLERKVKENILENIKRSIDSFQIKHIQKEISDFHYNYPNVELTLENFLNKTEIPLYKIYQNNPTNYRTWTTILNNQKGQNNTSIWMSRIAFGVCNKWLSTDSFSYFKYLYHIAHDLHFKLEVSSMSEIEKRKLTMLYYDLFDKANVYTSLQEFVDALAQDVEAIEELSELMHLFMQRTQTLEIKETIQIAKLKSVPLEIHARYTKSQIQAAMGFSTIQKKSTVREGVERDRTLKIENMYVDLIKDRKEDSTTNYKDAALSDTLFQWETQSRISQKSPTGQNYINKKNTMLLFVREQNKGVDDKSRTEGFIYLGVVHLHHYQGDSPIKIQWKLQHPMPASLWHFAAKNAIAG